MARTVLTPTVLVANAAADTPAGTAIAELVALGAVFTPVGALEQYLIRVTNTAGAAKNVTIGAGDSPPALSAGQGALVKQVALTVGDVLLGPLTSARFVQKDGTVEIDFEAGMTGFVSVIQIPRTA